MMELIMGTWVTQTITAAVYLGISVVCAQMVPRSPEELASRVNADAHASHRMFRGLADSGIFRQRRDGHYEPTALAGNIAHRFAVSLAGLARWVGSPHIAQHRSHLTPAMRTGSAVSEFAILPVIAAYNFTGLRTIVDRGGGHDRVLAAILESAPHSRGILFDLPEVVAKTPSLLRKHGVEKRVQIVGGSFFESAPRGADAYVLKNVIHDWPDEDAACILRTVRSTAEPGTRVLLVEFVIPTHHRNFHGNWVDLEMLVVAGARERTAAEYGRLLHQSGFRLDRIVDTVGPVSIIEAIAI